MHIRWMADIAAQKTGLLLHPQRMQCKLYIYRMKCSPYLPDSAQTVSIPMNVGWEEWVDNNIKRVFIHVKNIDIIYCLHPNHCETLYYNKI